MQRVRWLFDFAFLIFVAATVLGLWPLLFGGAGASVGDLTIQALGPGAAEVPLGMSGAHVVGLLVTMTVPQWVGVIGAIEFAVRLFGGLVALFLLRQVFGAMPKDGYFTRQSAKRLSAAGWVLIAAEGLNIILSLARETWLRGIDAKPGWTFAIATDRDVGLIIAGLVLLAVAQSFRAAAVLRENDELTI